MAERILYIMRGLPGSGKSTVAAKLAGRSHVFAADDYFVGPDGVYRFDAEKLAAAHEWCLAAVRRAMQDAISPVAVANTNVLKEHMRPYREMASEFGYSVVVLTVESDFTNVHGVPAQIIAQMAAQFEH